MTSRTLTADNKILELHAKSQIAKVKLDATCDAPSTQKKKHFPIDKNHVVGKCYLASKEECIDMIKNNYNFWAIVGAGASTFGDVTISGRQETHRGRLIAHTPALRPHALAPGKPSTIPRTVAS